MSCRQQKVSLLLTWTKQ